MADDRTAPVSDVPAVGRLADVHMWRIRDGWTSRMQAFRDETGRTFAVTTRRTGDRGPGHINGAEMFLADAWAQFFPGEASAPELIANVLVRRWKPTTLMFSMVVPADAAAAARTLLGEPVELGREDGRAWYINGQHRTEAMLRQGVENTLLRHTRAIDGPPFAGELGPVIYV